MSQNHSWSKTRKKNTNKCLVYYSNARIKTCIKVFCPKKKLNICLFSTSRFWEIMISDTFCYPEVKSQKNLYWWNKVLRASFWQMGIPPSTQKMMVFDFQIPSWEIVLWVQKPYSESFKFISSFFLKFWHFSFFGVLRFLLIFHRRSVDVNILYYMFTDSKNREDSKYAIKKLFWPVVLV